MVSAELGADPSAFTKAQMAAKLKHYLGGDMIAANVGYFQKLQRRGLREMGASKTVSTTASEVINNHNSRGLEVHVTVCADQTGITVVDKAGEKASDEYQPPAFNLRQFSVRKPHRSRRLARLRNGDGARGVRALSLAWGRVVAVVAGLLVAILGN